MNYRIVQTTEINPGNFTFLEPTNVKYPIAPMVSSSLLNTSGENPILKIRTTLYINSKKSDTPSVKSLTVKDNILTIKYKCSSTESTPETCAVWYIEIDYTGEDANEISQVISFLKNGKSDDNEEIESDNTSRGTKTDPDDGYGL